MNEHRSATIPNINQVYLLEGKPVYVLHGAYMIDGRVSNHWTFRYINEDGTLGEDGHEYGGVGWVHVPDAIITIKAEMPMNRLESIKDYEEQIAILKNAAAQNWQTAEERKRLIEESVKLEVKVIAMKNAEKQLYLKEE